jgi:hypothetical protein
LRARRCFQPRQLRLKFIHPPGQFLNPAPVGKGSGNEPDAESGWHAYDEQDDNSDLIHIRNPSDSVRPIAVAEMPGRFEVHRPRVRHADAVA